MSTYLSGNPTYLPQIQPFKPNLNLYAGVLQMKQSKFDTAHKQLNSLYGSLLNSKMLRNDTNEARDEYFKNIQDEIKRIANVDLSLSENLTTAESLFDNLANNDAIAKDMSFTKSYMSQIKRADALRTITDPEKGGGQYWEEGVQALHMKAQEFASSDLDSALRMSSPKYTPYVDVMGKAMKIAKDLGFEDAKFDTVTNEWIVTEKGGDRIAPHLMAVFQSQLGNDPMVKDMYQTKAYVARKNWVSNNIEQYGSEEAATEAYIKNVNAVYYSKMGKTKEDIELQNRYLEERLNNVTSNAEPWEMVEGNSSYEESDKYIRAIALNKGTVEYIDKEITTHDNTNRLQNLKSIAESMDNTYASLMMFDEFSNAANTYAQGKYERTVSVNQWGLERQKHEWAKELKQIQFEHDKELAKLKKSKESAEEESLGDGLNLTPLFPNDNPNESETDPGASNRMFNEKRSELWKETLSSRTNVLTQFVDIIEDSETSKETLRRVNIEIAKERINELSKEEGNRDKIKDLKNELKYYTSVSSDKVDNRFFNRYVKGGIKLKGETVKNIYNNSKNIMSEYFKDNKNVIDQSLVHNLSSTMNLIEKKVKDQVLLYNSQVNIKRAAMEGLSQVVEDDKLKEITANKDNMDYLLDASGNFKNTMISSVEMTIRDVFKNDPYLSDGAYNVTGEGRVSPSAYGGDYNKALAAARKIQKEKFNKEGVLVTYKNGKTEKVIYAELVDDKGFVKSKYKYATDIKFRQAEVDYKRQGYNETLESAGEIVRKDKATASLIVAKVMAGVSANKRSSLNVGYQAASNLNESLYSQMDKVEFKGRNASSYISELVGIGSEAPKGFAFNISPEMNDVNHKGHEYFVGVKEYLKDVNDNITNSDNVSISLTDENFNKYAKDIYRDVLNLKKYDGLKVEYLSKIKNNDDFQALKINVPKEILKKYLTTDELKEIGTLKLNLTLADKVSTNSFYNSTKLDPAELAHKANNHETKIDSRFNKYFKGSIVNDANGNYVIKGSMQNFDEQGKPVPAADYYEVYDKNLYNVSMVKANFEKTLSDYANYLTNGK